MHCAKRAAATKDSPPSRSNAAAKARRGPGNANVAKRCARSRFQRISAQRNRLRTPPHERTAELKRTGAARLRRDDAHPVRRGGASGNRRCARQK